MKIRRIINKIISSVLIISILSISLSACGKQGEAIPEYNVDENTTIDTGTIAEIITEEIKNEVSEIQEETDETKPVEISTDWNDYVGDLDTFVYGLISAEYSLCYDVFEACVDLSDGTRVYGLAYSDYSGVFESDEDETFFPAGFISLIGEPEIPAEEVEGGLVIENLQTDDDCQFIYSYDIEPYMEHCVIWDQYLKYGIDEKGAITYEASNYTKGKCDESIGSLYSYDEKKYLFDPNVGDYKYIAGDSLYTSIDYSDLEAEVNRILDEQDINFSQVDIETSAYIAQEAVNSFLLSMQEETFMGYDVKTLIAAAEELDPMECIQLTPDGMVIMDANMPEEESPTALMKWVTGITCLPDFYIPSLNRWFEIKGKPLNSDEMKKCEEFCCRLDNENIKYSVLIGSPNLCAVRIGEFFGILEYVWEWPSEKYPDNFRIQAPKELIKEEYYSRFLKGLWVVPDKTEEEVALAAIVAGKARFEFGEKPGM